MREPASRASQNRGPHRGYSIAAPLSRTFVAFRLSPPAAEGVAPPLRRRAPLPSFPAYPIVELNAPPSSSRFWPTIKPELAAHRKAQASPNSFGSPTRPVGFVAERRASISSNEMFWRRASNSIPER